MERNYIIGIDQGSTGSKAIIVDKEGNVIHSAYRPIESYYPKEGWLEHDAEEIWISVKECILELSKGFDFKKIRAIGITNQRESTLLWEKKTGKALTPVISWQCVRSKEIAERWQNDKQKIMMITGLSPSTYYSASKIVWILENNEKLRTRCENGEVLFGNLNTWIIWKLTGMKNHITDSTNAGRTMLFDVKKNCWSNELINKFNIPKRILPNVIESNGYFGEAVEPKEAFIDSIPIRASIGDQMSALFGQGCFETGKAKCSIGTCLNLVTYTGKYKEPVSGIFPAIACNESGTLTYETEGGVNVAGSVIEWLIHQLQIVSDAKEASRLASEIDSTEGVYFVPAFGGLYAPYWNDTARGLIIGLSRFHNKKHICRAAYESIALQTSDIIKILKRDLQIDIKVIRVDGGVCKSDFVMQLFANILNCKIERPVDTDRTPMGAVYVAGLASGLWKNKKEIEDLWKLDKAFEPNMSQEKRDKLIKGWHEAVNRSFNWTK